MISGDAKLVDALDLLIDGPDLAALEATLMRADSDGLNAAVSWARHRQDEIAEYRPDESYETGADRRWMPIVIAAAALPPAEAVKRLPWNDFWFVRPHQAELLVRTLLRRPREWAERFVPAVARVRLGSRREPDTAPFLFWVLDKLIREHSLDVPDGDAFLNGWARGRRELTDPLYLVLLPRLLRSPHLRHRPDVMDALPRLRAGGVSREDLVGAVLGALTTPSRPASQRVLAKLWMSIAPERHELNGRLPLLLSALATSHGSLTEPLLPAAVSLAVSAVDLDEIARTITGRPEKRQHVLLLRLLEDPELRQRLGDEAVADAASRYQVVDDAAVRDRAARLVRALGAASTGVGQRESAGDHARFDGLWSPLPRRRRVAVPLEIPARLSHPLIQQLLGEQWSRPFVAVRHGEINRVGEAVLLECLVRATSGGRAANVRAWLPPSDAPLWRGLQPVASAILCWLRGDLGSPPLYDTRIPGNFVGNAEPRWQGIAELVNAAAREALAKAGELRTVLSTPNHDDGTLDVHVLVERVASGAVSSYTPHDLALALFRLAPHFGDTPDLTGLRLAADTGAWLEHVEGQQVAAPDGIELLELWLREGGLSPCTATYRFEELSSGRTAWLWDAENPPYPAKALDLLRIDHTRLLATVSLPDAVALAPGWPDLSATGDNWRWTNAGVLIDGPGPLCTPSHAVLLTMMTGEEDDRTLGATRLLELVTADRLSDRHLREAAEVLSGAGLLPLSRFAQVIERAFSSGGSPICGHRRSASPRTQRSGTRARADCRNCCGRSPPMRRLFQTRSYPQGSWTWPRRAGHRRATPRQRHLRAPVGC